jgi:hypothetical protein
MISWFKRAGGNLAQSSACARPAQLGPPAGVGPHASEGERNGATGGGRRSARGGEEPAAGDLGGGSLLVI